MALDKERFVSTIGLNDIECELPPGERLIARALGTALDDCRRVIHGGRRSRKKPDFVVEAASAITFILSPRVHALFHSLNLDQDAVAGARSIALAALEALDLELWMLNAPAHKWLTALDRPGPDSFPELFPPPRPTYELQMCS